MTQTYQMKHNAQGTIFSLLTVESDGQMTMTFHGTDREISHEANVTEDGRIATAGSLFPGLESGKWQAVAAQMRNEKLEMRNENEELRNEVAESETTIQGTVPAVGSEAESERTTEGLSPMCLSPMCAEPAVQALRGQAPCNPPSATHTGDSPRHTGDSPRVRRQHKQRKPRVERQEPFSPCERPEVERTINHEPLTVNHQPSSTLKAVGMVAAATVALLVIYETGLLIPLGLIGLATGGLLK